MGRKRVPKGRRKRVKSFSLSPSVIKKLKKLKKKGESLSQALERLIRRL